jgi:hypothetical protein
MNSSKQIAMYGITEAEIESQYMESITARLSGLEMVIAGLLSDCQELISFGNKQATDQARKNMNIAKHILFKMIEQREVEFE